MVIEKEELYGYQTLFREIGYYITRLEQYERALKWFDEALRITPNDKRALIGRSKARAKACQYEGAIADINKALKIDSGDLIVLAHKALNTFLGCEFEDSVVQNVRFAPIRKKPDDFILGVMTCTNAIENCIGERSGRPLRDHFKIIRNLAWKRNFENQKPFQPKAKRKTRKIGVKETEAVVEGRLKHLPRKSVIAQLAAEERIRDSLYSHETEQNYIPPYNKPFPFKPLQNYTSNIANYMAEKYLNSMYEDKLFLEQLKTEPGFSSPNKEGTNKLKQLASVGYKNVFYKQELLRTRRPFYFLKYQEAKSTGGLRYRQKAALDRQREQAAQIADNLMADIEKLLEMKQLRPLAALGEKLREFCISTHIKILPNRQYYLQKLYGITVDAYYDVFRINPNQKEHDQNKRINVIFGLNISREPSEDSVIPQFKSIYVDFKKMISQREKRLMNSSSFLEMALLYHELSFYHLELKHFEMARVYARKCIREGKQLKNFKLVVIGLITLTNISLVQKNKNDAKTQLQQVMAIAKERKDAALEDYITRCMSVFERLEEDETVGLKVLEKREQQIIKLMTNSKMKDEFAHLFRTMSAMPPQRRMAIIPGLRMEDLEPSKTQQSTKRKTTQDHEMTEDGQRTPIKPKRAMRKKKITEEPKRGLGFMEYIKYHID